MIKETKWSEIKLPTVSAILISIFRKKGPEELQPGILSGVIVHFSPFSALQGFFYFLFVLWFHWQ